ncbi:putative efflux protein, MATE family [Allopseudospirillum japonicum]|uniref:Multidrug-efflux transporter n=1 Tax=Allopseudospirillum japonicum TaxID=64971 RepID=A0A1H6S968_9GAMM|nr:MATE family efflux transporter [Allopseudospirillum japonicum]SEI64658.1 putative efflux protein, MATE family [Allopseudospirillum japonicum]
MNRHSASISQRIQHILALALPIMGGMLSQSLLNLVDAALVGQLGEIALAGVGIGGYITFMLTALLMGLSSGVQAQVAGLNGARRYSERARPLNAGIVLALALGIPLTSIGYLHADTLVALLSQDLQVQTLASDYLALRAFAFLPVAINLCFRGYWNGIHQAGLYLKIILLMHGTNVILTWWLIQGGLGIPPLGVQGAALGTSLSVTLGCILWTWLTWKRACPSGFVFKPPSWALIWKTSQRALPTSVQQALFAAGYAVLFWILGQIDAASVAIGHVLVNLSLLLILPAVGLGMAAMTLVGHSLGARAFQQAYLWGWDVTYVAFGLLLLLSLPLFLYPDVIVALFLTDPGLQASAIFPLQLTALMIVLDTGALVFNQALQGIGAHKAAMQLALSLQWGLFLPLAWWLGVYLGYGLLGIWWLQLAYRGLHSCGFIWLWYQGFQKLRHHAKDTST